MERERERASEWGSEGGRERERLSSYLKTLAKRANYFVKHRQGHNGNVSESQTKVKVNK